jgi:hypothetical protein
MFDERMNNTRYMSAMKFYPANLLDALIELYHEHSYNISTVDNWIIYAFGHSHGVVHGEPFTALAELDKEFIKSQLWLMTQPVTDLVPPPESCIQ